MKEFFLSSLAVIRYYILYPHPRSLFFFFSKEQNRVTDTENRPVVAKVEKGGGGMEGWNGSLGLVGANRCI